MRSPTVAGVLRLRMRANISVPSKTEFARIDKPIPAPKKKPPKTEANNLSCVTIGNSTNKRQIDN